MKDGKFFIEAEIMVDKKSSYGGDQPPDYKQFFYGIEGVTNRILVMGGVRVHVIKEVFYVTEFY